MYIYRKRERKVENTVAVSVAFYVMLHGGCLFPGRNCRNTRKSLRPWPREAFEKNMLPFGSHSEPFWNTNHHHNNDQWHTHIYHTRASTQKGHNPRAYIRLAYCIYIYIYISGSKPTHHPSCSSYGTVVVTYREI